MPDPGPGSSRLCPSCGRRVPETVTTCHCGTPVPDAGEEASEDGPTPGGGLSLINVMVGVLLLAAVAGTGYWTVTRPPATVPGRCGPGRKLSRLDPPWGRCRTAGRAGSSAAFGARMMPP